jgi:simple sugar transport system ATP-binding protein
MEISDRVTVLRGGETIETVMTKDADINSLIEKMVGKKIDLKIFRENHAGKNEILKVSNLYFKSDDGKFLLKDLSFEVNSFEILGIAGISGSGQKELCETIAGLRQADSGKITLSDENILGKSPSVIMKKGIRLGFIPEDRLGMGLVSSMDIVHNVALKEYQKEKGHRLKTEGSKVTAGKIVTKLDVKTPSLKTKIAKLSGGNIQKILLGREISAKPKVLITAYPARGLDIVASHKIYDLLNEQKKNGVAIIFIGEDLDVLLSISDRLMVMHEGEIAKILDPKKATKEEVGLLMTGTESADEVGEMVGEMAGVG